MKTIIYTILFIFIYLGTCFSGDETIIWKRGQNTNVILWQLDLKKMSGASWKKITLRKQLEKFYPGKHVTARKVFIKDNKLYILVE